MLRFEAKECRRKIEEGSERARPFLKNRGKRVGGIGGGEAPGPMPNPEVKPSSADGTTDMIRGRVGRRRLPCF